ncbi:hypothetical protein JCM6882_002583 [Rhodosporidiobolus microsporus]
MQVDIDDFRLPTPPPLPPGAPTYRLPLKSDRFPRFATLEYPGPVRSVDAALGSVGGIDRVSDALSSDQPKPIELNLQPDNPFFHTIPAHTAKTNNVVVKIVKKRRKRPLRDEQGRVIEEGVFTLEPVGIEQQTVRFRAMADFQFAPKVSKEDPMMKLADSIRTLDIDGIRNFTMPQPVEDFPESIYIPPPSFSRHGLPQIFDMKPASSTVRTTTESGTVRLINQTRHKTRALQSILFVQPDVPQAPEAAFLKELGRTDLSEIEKRMRELLEERPVWTRTAMLNQLTPEEFRTINTNKNIWPIIGYTFSDGPFRDFIIRFGYDPRQDPEARFYQHVTLRNAANVRSKVTPGTRGLIQAQSASSRKGKEKAAAAFTASNRSHEFDGQTIHSKIGNFQLCDISDPLLRSLIDSDEGVLPVCSPDINEGWYAFDYFDQIRQVVRRKWQGLLGGLQVTDEDCADLLRWEKSAESRAGQVKTQRTAGPPPTPAASGAEKEKGGKGKGKGSAAKKGKGRARSDSGSGSASGSGSGMDEDEEEEEPEPEPEPEEGDEGSGSDAASSRGPSSSSATPVGKAGKGTKKKPPKSTRAPWEAPRMKRNKAKQPETESQVLARLNRSLRRSTRGGTETPGPDTGPSGSRA